MHTQRAQNRHERCTLLCVYGPSMGKPACTLVHRTARWRCGAHYREVWRMLTGEEKIVRLGLLRGTGALGCGAEDSTIHEQDVWFLPKLARVRQPQKLRLLGKAVEPRQFQSAYWPYS